jgi:hypothetical protein
MTKGFGIDYDSGFDEPSVAPEPMKSATADDDVIIDYNVDGSYNRTIAPGPDMTRGGSRYVLRVPRQRQYEDPNIEVVDDGSVSVPGNGRAVAVDEDDDDSVRKSSFNGCRKLTICAVMCFAVLLVVIVVSLTTVGKKNNAQETETFGSFSQAQTPAQKQSGCTEIADTYEPKLDFTFQVPTGSGLFTADETAAMEVAIMEAYNDVSLGCLGDDYNRYMYNVSMIHQQVSTYQNNGEAVTVIDALIGSKISCVDCSEDSCFASEFPSGGSRRQLQSGDRLNGAEIIAKMEEKLSTVVTIDSIVSAKVSVDSADGGIASNTKSIRVSDLEQYTSEEEAAVADAGNETVVADGGSAGGVSILFVNGLYF